MTVDTHIGIYLGIQALLWCAASILGFLALAADQWGWVEHKGEIIPKSWDMAGVVMTLFVLGQAVWSVRVFLMHAMK
jgi:hypothetical protein